jgi:hypothetical protein
MAPTLFPFVPKFTIVILMIAGLAMSGCTSNSDEGDSSSLSPNDPGYSELPNPTYEETASYDVFVDGVYRASFDSKVTQNQEFLVETTMHWPDLAYVPFDDGRTFTREARNYTIASTLSSTTGELIESRQDPHTLISGGSGGQVGFAYPNPEPTTLKFLSLDKWILHAEDWEWFISGEGDQSATLHRPIIPIGLQIPILNGAPEHIPDAINIETKISDETLISWSTPCYKDCYHLNVDEQTYLIGNMTLQGDGILPREMNVAWTLEERTVEYKRTNYKLEGAPLLGQSELIKPAKPLDVGDCGPLPCDGENWPATWGFESAWTLQELNPVHLSWAATKSLPPTLFDSEINTFLEIREINFAYIAVDGESRTYFYVIHYDETDTPAPVFRGFTSRQGTITSGTSYRSEIPDVAMPTLSSYGHEWAKLLPPDATIVEVEYVTYYGSVFPDPTFRYDLVIHYDAGGKLVSIRGSAGTGEWYAIYDHENVIPSNSSNPKFYVRN